MSATNSRELQIATIVNVLLLGATIVLILWRTVFFGVSLEWNTLGVFLILSIPLLVRQLRWYDAYCVAVSWVPTLALYYSIIEGDSPTALNSLAIYDGMKILLLGFSSLSFVLFTTKDPIRMFLGLVVPVAGVLFVDDITELMGVGPSRFPDFEKDVRFNALRTNISFLVLAGSFLTMRLIVDRNDRENQRLISELDEKNQTIAKQSQHELNRINQQLSLGLDHLSRSEAKLIKANRELALLNSVGDATNRSTVEQSLLADVCGILVREGGYRLAWFGAEREPGKVIPIASDGTSVKYASNLVIDLNSEAHRDGPSAQSYLTGRTQVINKILEDPKYEAWRSRAERFGFQSSIGLSVNIPSDKPYILNVYSRDPDSFDAHEVSTLERIATNVGKAIHGLRVSKERDEAKRELAQAYERLSYHLSNSPLAVIERDKHLKITFWNKRAEELFGYSAEEAVGLSTHQLIIKEEDVEEIRKTIDEFRQTKAKVGYREWRNTTKDGRELHCRWYYSMLRNDKGELEAVLSFVSDFTEQKSLLHKLSERIKELSTLFQVSQILSRDNRTIDETMEVIVNRLPAGWQYPDVCASRINLFGKTYQTRNFLPTAYSQRAEIVVEGSPAGFMEIVYLEPTPEEAEGPFFTEERQLLQALAEMIQIYLERKSEEAELQRTQASLRATINNTEIQIWSFDANLRLVMFNEPYAKFRQGTENISPVLGMSLETLYSTNDSDKWTGRCRKVLGGDKLVIEETTYETDFKYSLSPVYEDTRIVGVSIFGDNITEKNLRERELKEATSHINELRMMALRSVMNPHFIFNVLTSIQFFITRNDRLNAINYLASFSKLMRTVLSRSTADRISLSDELDLLKNYINLEKLRFEQKFDYNIQAENVPNIDDCMIPSLLIQPYVENAILHGLQGKKDGNGLLSIRVRDESGYLLFEIEDNGIGRAEAKKLKRMTNQGHTSMGTKLTEERLRLLNPDTEVSVNYRDLITDNQPSGTLVQIRIRRL